MSEGVPKLLDFGIAKLLDPEISPSSLTPTPLVLRPMTPEFASPEQARGDVITTASDIYSLGVMLYRLLTGHLPYRFSERTPMAMAGVICKEVPERPSARVLRREPETEAGPAARDCQGS